MNYLEGFSLLLGTAAASSPGSIATAVTSGAREATTNRRTFEDHALLDRGPMTVDSTPPNGRGNESRTGRDAANPSFCNLHH